MGEIEFSKSDLINFINDWDPINEKYFYCIDKDKYKDNVVEQLYNKIWDSFYIDANSSVSKEKIFKVYQSIKHIYIDNANEYSQIVENVFNKFIYQFVNIDGIDMLFDSTYFDIEWQMHFSYNFDDFISTYYRDHYVHQIRNMFEILSLLKNMKIDEYCYDWFNNKNTNIVCNYIKALLKYDVKNMSVSKYNLYKKIVECRKDFKIANKSKDKGEINNSVYEEFILKQLFHETIYSTAIISSLVHDIGYPLSFVLKLNKTVLDFLPNSMRFIASIDNIDYIESKLKDSLLLKLVGIKEIEKGLKKYDHGVLSAIILLLYYYDNGKLYSLSKTERAIIEYSSLIIYNHTIQYKNQENKNSTKRYDYIKNTFVKNPLSYVFRICDDIQEWDRVYFENTSASNYFICGECLTPTVRYEKDMGLLKYVCSCKNLSNYNLRVNSYRKTINVICCKKVCISYDNTGHNIIPEYKQIKFNFDLFNMLEIIKYNPGYAEYRAKEIKKLKIALMEQNDFGYTYVDAFISNNPVELKLEILKRYIDLCKRNDEQEQIDSSYILMKFDLNSRIGFDFFKHRLDTYIKMVNCINKLSDDNRIDKNTFMNDFQNTYDDIDNKDFKELANIAGEKYYNSYQCTYKKMIMALKSMNVKDYQMLNNEYLNLHLTSKKEILYLNNYINRRDYIEFIYSHKKEDNWNYYLDIYMFYLMNEKIKE